MKRQLGTRMKLNRETLRRLGDFGHNLRDQPQSWPDSTPHTVCCTASCHHIC